RGDALRRAAGERVGRVECGPATAQGIHPARRQSGGSSLPPCADHRAPGRTAREHAGEAGGGAAGGPPLPQPLVGPAVRRGETARTGRIGNGNDLGPEPDWRLNWITGGPVAAATLRRDYFSLRPVPRTAILPPAAVS